MISKDAGRTWSQPIKIANISLIRCATPSAATSCAPVTTSRTSPWIGAAVTSTSSGRTLALVTGRTWTS